MKAIPKSARFLAQNSILDAGVAFILTMFLPLTMSATSPQQFSLPYLFFAGGPFVSSAATGDFNKDGKVDIALADSASVALLLGNGDGTFQPPAYYSSDCVNSGQIVALDANSDGNLDVIMTCYGSMSVLLGNGDGTFGLPSTFYENGYRPGYLTVGDFNGDGKLDLVSAGVLPGKILVNLGNGDGTFKSLKAYSTGGSESGAVAVADINGDGKLDVVVQNVGHEGKGDIAVLLGQGDGSFQTGVPYRTEGSPTGFALSDFNGDGILDLVVTAYESLSESSVSFLRGNGDGTFEEPTTIVKYPSEFAAGNVVSADFNEDGHPDVAITDSEDSTVKVLLGHGDGTFHGINDRYYAAEPYGQPALGDFNGDGYPDLVATYSFGATVLLGKGNGTFLSPLTYSGGSGISPYAVAVGDLNGDGKLDIITANSQTFLTSGGLTVLLSGEHGFGVAQNLVVGISPQSVAVGDFNRDGKLDVVLGDFEASAALVLLGNGNGTFQPALSLPADQGSTAVAVADFNGDGKPDLVLANSGGNDVSVILGNGDGTFQPAVNYPAGTACISVVVADFNRDGKPDIAVADSTFTGPDVSVLLGNGDGTFQPALGDSTGFGASSIVAGDFNNDGKPDLAIEGEGMVRVLLGNGDGTFQPATTYSTGYEPLSVTTADFNGDGKLDLMVYLRFTTYPPSTPGIALLYGNGDGTFGTAIIYPAPLSGVGVADLNGATFPDLVGFGDLTDAANLYVIPNTRNASTSSMRAAN